MPEDSSALTRGTGRAYSSSHERSQRQIGRRAGAEAARASPRGADDDRAPAQGREPLAPDPPGHAVRRALGAAAEERAGPGARRGHDWPAQVHGARRVSDAPLARVSVRILEKEYQFSCAVEE